jgi:DNA-directed RNA polymerase subunit beta'
MINSHRPFDYIKINLASPERIKKWGQRILPTGQFVGEVTKPDTLNYRTLKPEFDGLFCERIFGPIKNWECHCGKYRGVELSSYVTCNRCGVEITDSRVRRYRMGHIRLVSPVAHIWYLKGIPSYISLLLFIKLKYLEEIVYYNHFLSFENRKIVYSTKYNDLIYQDFSYSYNEESYSTHSRRVMIGGQAIKYLLGNLNLVAELTDNRTILTSLSDANSDITMGEVKKTTGFTSKSFTLQSNNKNIFLDTRRQLIRRIRLIENFIATGSKPSWMVLTVLPVIPAGLRPMIQLDSGSFATSDLNELYRRVITRNNRLAKLIKLYAPTLIIHNEKRMLQEAVDTLINNGKRGEKVLGSNNRPLKSLSNIIEGKNGRFRKNLLGKRVDYSGRSVIIVGPSLKLNQCGLPCEIALELFQPFIIRELINNGLSNNMKFARKLIRTGQPVIWTILENILKTHPIFLNRAPTLHRLGIQAFEPILVEGRAIKLHPLVCPAFNADFDGDQMAVHVPLSLEAQVEARTLMLSTNNFLSPATGEPILLPSQDMILGYYYMTVDSLKPTTFADHYFSSISDVILAYSVNKITLHTPIWLRFDQVSNDKLSNVLDKKQSRIKLINHNNSNEKSKYIQTTPGRVLVNQSVFKNLNS